MAFGISEGSAAVPPSTVSTAPTLAQVPLSAADVFERSPQKKRRAATAPSSIEVLGVGPVTKQGKKGAFKEKWPHNVLTPLQQAIRDNASTEVLRLLNEARCDIEARDSEGHTALHIAALLNSEKYVSLLLERDANTEANDNLGLTPVYLAAKFGAFGTLEMLLDEAQAYAPDDAGWIETQDVARYMAALQDHHRTRQSIDAEAVNAMASQLLGRGRKGMSKYDTLKDMLLYHAHLQSLTGSQMGLELEGWDEAGMLAQRIRTLLRIAAQPYPLPQGMDASVVANRFVAALRCDLEQVRLMARLVEIEDMAEERRAPLLKHEAEHLSALIQTWPQQQELSIPTGWDEHTAYVSFSRRDIGTTPVITVRLDNLGGANRSAQYLDAQDKVTPLTFNIPESFLAGPQGEEALVRTVQRLLTCRTGKNDHSFNGALFTLVRQLKRSFDAHLIEASPFVAPAYHHKQQLVGNCVLKNHSAGLCARLGRPLFRWYKDREVKDVETRLGSLLNVAQLHTFEHAKWSELWNALVQASPLDMDAVRAFLAKPGRAQMMKQLNVEGWRLVVDADDAELIELVLKHGARFPEVVEHRSTLLHQAVRGGFEEALQILLERDAVAVDAKNERGETALLLAAVGEKADMMKLLLQHGANGSLADDDGLTANSVVRKRARSAKQVLHRFNLAARNR